MKHLNFAALALILAVFIETTPAQNAKEVQRVTESGNYEEPSPSRENWTSRLLVLLENDPDAEKTKRLILEINAGNGSDFELQQLDRFEPAFAFTLLPLLPEASLALNKIFGEPARSKLGRYIVIEFPGDVDMEEVLLEISRDPAVAYASISERSELDPLLGAQGSRGKSKASRSKLGLTNVSSNAMAHMPSQNTMNTGTAVVTTNRTWGFDEVNGHQGQLWQRGHAYVGILDLGIDTVHLEHRDFTGSIWRGGNFHKPLAWKVGSSVTVSSTTGIADPFSGLALAGDVDEYNFGTLPAGTNNTPPADPSCDGTDLLNPGPTTEMSVVGHGTHVAGILAANATNSVGVRGVCRHCPLAIWIGAYVDGRCLNGLYHPDGSVKESWVFVTGETLWRGIAGMVNAGVQVINWSGADSLSTRPGNFCTVDADSDGISDNEDNFRCLVLDYAEDRDVFFVAAAGNNARDFLDFPASEPRVTGVSGWSHENGGEFWEGSPGFGSNFDTDSAYGPTFAAPAVEIYSTMYEGKDYSPDLCEERNDGVQDGYGYCTGTSMSSPFIAGLAALVRSAIPLASTQEIRSILRASSPQTGWDSELGFGIPNAESAIRDHALGKSGVAQIHNRATPLFAMRSTTANDIVHTTKPQVAAAFSLNGVWNYAPHLGEALVPNYQFPESSLNPGISVPRADVFVFTSHRTPNHSSLAVKPLYRVRFVGPSGGNNNNADWAIALANEMSGPLGWKAKGYELDGMEGYIYNTCTPESTCIPTGAIKLYRAYNPDLDDYAVFSADRYNSMVNTEEYDQEITLLGYALKNDDTDQDGVINGMEAILGTDPGDTDTDCDGMTDGFEYPWTRHPRSNPRIGSC